MEKIAEMWTWKTSDPMHPTLPKKIQISQIYFWRSVFLYLYFVYCICSHLTKRMVKIICGKYHNYWSHLTITVTYWPYGSITLSYSYCPPQLNIIPWITIMMMTMIVMTMMMIMMAMMMRCLSQFNFAIGGVWTHSSPMWSPHLTKLQSPDHAGEENDDDDDVDVDNHANEDYEDQGDPEDCWQECWKYRWSGHKTMMIMMILMMTMMMMNERLVMMIMMILMMTMIIEEREDGNGEQTSVHSRSSH